MVLPARSFAPTDRSNRKRCATTIVGGRPPGSGQPVGEIPRGIEVLVKKAAVDAEFKALLLSRRAAAAEAIGLTLQPAEAAMLAVAPAEQLEAIIARTSVPQEHRRAFLGWAAAAMLAALGALATAKGCELVERAKQEQFEKPYGADRPKYHGPAPGGARPDRPYVGPAPPPPSPADKE